MTTLYLVLAVVMLPLLWYAGVVGLGALFYRKVIESEWPAEQEAEDEEVECLRICIMNAVGREVGQLRRLHGHWWALTAQGEILVSDLLKQGRGAPIQDVIIKKRSKPRWAQDAKSSLKKHSAKQRQ